MQDGPNLTMIVAAAKKASRWEEVHIFYKSRSKNEAVRNYGPLAADEVRRVTESEDARFEIERPDFYGFRVTNPKVLLDQIEVFLPYKGGQITMSAYPSYAVIGDKRSDGLSNLYIGLTSKEWTVGLNHRENFPEIEASLRKVGIEPMLITPDLDSVEKYLFSSGD